MISEASEQIGIEKPSGERIVVTQYLVLLKLSPTKVIDIINDLRSLPQRPSPEINLRYVMNVFGTWDLAIWLEAEKSNQALDFVHNKLNDVPGIVDLYTVLAFPNRRPNRMGRTS